MRSSVWTKDSLKSNKCNFCNFACLLRLSWCIIFFLTTGTITSTTFIDTLIITLLTLQHFQHDCYYQHICCAHHIHYACPLRLKISKLSSKELASPLLQLKRCQTLMATSLLSSASVALPCSILLNNHFSTNARSL